MRPRARARRRRRIFYGLRTAQRTKGAPVRRLFRALIAEGRLLSRSGLLPDVSQQQRRKRSGQKQTGYESATPERDSDSRQKRVEFFAGTATSPQSASIDRQRLLSPSAPERDRTISRGTKRVRIGDLRESLPPAAEGKRGLSPEREAVKSWLTNVRRASDARRPGLERTANGGSTNRAGIGDAPSRRAWRAKGKPRGRRIAGVVNGRKGHLDDVARAAGGSPPSRCCARAVAHEIPRLLRAHRLRPRRTRRPRHPGRHPCPVDSRPRVAGPGGVPRLRSALSSHFPVSRRDRARSRRRTAGEVRRRDDSGFRPGRRRRHATS